MWGEAHRAMAHDAWATVFISEGLTAQPGQHDARSRWDALVWWARHLSMVRDVQASARPPRKKRAVAEWRSRYTEHTKKVGLKKDRLKKER